MSINSVKCKVSALHFFTFNDSNYIYKFKADYFIYFCKSKIQELTNEYLYISARRYFRSLGL